MHTDHNENQQRLNLATNLAIRTGKYQVSMMDKPISVQTKSSPIDLVTEVDINSQEMVITHIKESYPNDSILAEEGDYTNNDIKSGWSWIIDPLDGTTNYTHQFPLFCVSIGIYYDLQPQYAVIHIPVSGETFTAVKNEGACLNGKRIHVTDKNHMVSCLLATGFPYDKANGADDNMDYFKRVIKLTHGIRRLGSAAIDLAYVACGRIDGYWELKLKPWDISAGALIVTEAGGRVTNFPAHDSLDLFNSHVLATNNVIHDDMLELLGG
jgi:myo-inositol-1(or 4)-monophosphatase